MIRKAGYRIGLALMLSLWASLVSAAELRGKVIDVADGDSLTLLVERTPVKIRLAEIDAPEKGQAFGNRAKQALADLTFGQTVTAIEQTTDRYGRTVARVYVGSRDVNAEMLRQGMAWVFDRYVTDRALYALQDQAKVRRIGLWNDPDAIPPWQFRAEARDPSLREQRLGAPGAVAVGTSTHVLLATQSPAGWRCGSKRFCREMGSCEEARFHLTTCGVTALDGDGDGVPCANLCGNAR